MSLVVITGERGVGKSVVCSRLAATLRERGVDIGGVLTERMARGDGREAVDVATGERRPFGRQERGAPPPGGSGAGSGAGPGSGSETGSGAGPGTDPLTPGWHYAEDVFQWGNDVCARARDCAVLFVDELGPVEILGGRGWTLPLERLRCGEYHDAVVVCRPALLERLAASIGRRPDAMFEVTLQNRGVLPERLAGPLAGTRTGRPGAGEAATAGS